MNKTNIVPALQQLRFKSGETEKESTTNDIITNCVKCHEINKEGTEIENNGWAHVK